MRFPSTGTPEFWVCYHQLPKDIRRLVRKNYWLWSLEPFHPSLNFKKVCGENWLVRIGMHYRALRKFVEGHFVWQWIGTHAEYDRLA